MVRFKTEHHLKTYGFHQHHPMLVLSAIGAALNYWNHITNDRKENKTPFLGPSEKLLDIVKIVKDNEDKIFYEALSDEELLPKVAKLISEGNIIGWVRGQLEFGARALGNRSILADPRDPQMKKRVNMVVKKREGFRPLLLWFVMKI